MNPRSLHFRMVAWYALWLGVVFATAGVVLYFGLRHYLENNLAAAQQLRAQRIAALVLHASMASERSVADEITARFAPEASSRFIRVTRPDSTVVYQSGAPIDQSFKPADISPPKFHPGTRNEKLRDGHEFILATVAAGPTNAPRLFVETGESFAPASIELRRLMIMLALAFVMVVSVALGGGFLLVRRALRPVKEITRSAEGITSRNLSERLPAPPTGDEFEHLSLSLNRMITRLEEAFLYNRRFLADASHELRTPLTVLRGELEASIQEKQLAPEYRERLGSALEEVERLANIVEGLFALARLDAGEAQAEQTRVDLAHLAASTAEQMVLLAEDKRIKMNCAAAKNVWVEGDPARLKQVVVNLLDNAIKYTPEGGTVSLSTITQNGHAVLEVSDTGIGIPKEALPHVFERFFRVDKARSRDLGGAGLGLSIVKSICTAHHGRVQVASVAGQGSCFRVELPLASNGSGPSRQNHEH